jgi:hypothetical protein
MQATLPITRHATGRTGHRLIDGMTVGWGEGGAVDVLLRPIVVEPILVRLEAPDNLVARLGDMLARVLGWRVIAAANVAAIGATPEMEPPAAFH